MKNFVSYLVLSPVRTAANFLKLFLVVVIIITESCSTSHDSTYETELRDPLYQITLPKQGWLKNDKPVGKGWSNLISSSLDDVSPAT